MDLALLIINGLILLLVGAAGAYLNTKLRNVAEKKQVKDITEKVEKIKTDFEKDKIRFSWFHQKQAEVIVEFYGMLKQSLDMIASFTSHVNYSDEEGFNELKIKTSDKIRDVRTYYENKAIFFSKQLKTQIEDLFDTFIRSYVKYDYAQLHLDGSDEKTQVVFEAFQKIDEEGREILIKLEDSFRFLIGGENKTNLMKSTNSAL